jgi:phospholipase/lecithinase/hemolysin/endonuclease/exonuclease/phosphatase family metal-dependent hydrolase
MCSAAGSNKEINVPSNRYSGDSRCISLARRRCWGLFVWPIVAAVLLTRTAVASPVQVTIMTQNMDEGTNYEALTTATDAPSFLAAVTQTYQEIAATTPSVRAAAMAQQIAAQQPTLVALQEASIVRTGTGLPATTVQSNLLQSLLSSLSQLGQHYAPAVVATELDATAPSTLGFNVRLTTQDVILARTDLPASQFSIANAQAHPFATQLVVQTPLGGIPLTRGWAAVDATVDGRSFRFVSTHLDTVAPVQFAQAQELLAAAGATSLPVIYAGDFNVAANDPSDPTFATYQALMGAGLGDAWSTLHPGDPGFTCCQEQDLLNMDSMLTQRIDLALFTDPFGVTDIHRVGISPFDRTDTGLWPSDHAGLVATFVLPAPEPAPIGLFGFGIVALGMMRRRKRIAGLLVGGALAAVAISPASAANYSALYAFGDSLSDAGNVFAATAGAEPAPPYSNGHYSNGPVWVQDLAARLGLGSLTPSLLGGTDYAAGSAQTGTTAVHAAGAADLPAQAIQFATAHPVAPSGALYTLAVGANDLFAVLQSANPAAVATPTIAGAVANIEGVVDGLAAAGARNFIVMTVPDLGITPAVTAFGPAASAFATALTATFNAALVSSLDGVASADGLDLRFLDAFALLDQEFASPSAFGFSDATTPCWSGDFFGQNGTLCANSRGGQDTHLFWDSVHPTEAGHALLGDAAVRLVPEPSSIALLFSALAAIGVVRSRTLQSGGAAKKPWRKLT